MQQIDNLIVAITTLGISYRSQKIDAKVGQFAKEMPIAVFRSSVKA